MRGEPTPRPSRHRLALPSNVRVSVVLAGLAAAFYVAMIMNHLSP